MSQEMGNCCGEFDMWLDINVHKEARYYQPYLNDKKLKNCFAASEAEGWADIYETNESGEFVFNIVKNGEIVQERVSGDPDFLAHDESYELKKKRIYGKIELRKEYGKFETFLGN